MCPQVPAVVYHRSCREQSDLMLTVSATFCVCVHPPASWRWWSGWLQALLQPCQKLEQGVCVRFIGKQEYFVRQPRTPKVELSGLFHETFPSCTLWGASKQVDEGSPPPSLYAAPCCWQARISMCSASLASTSAGRPHGVRRWSSHSNSCAEAPDSEQRHAVVPSAQAPGSVAQASLPTGPWAGPLLVLRIRERIPTALPAVEGAQHGRGPHRSRPGALPSPGGLSPAAAGWPPARASPPLPRCQSAQGAASPPRQQQAQWLSPATGTLGYQERMELGSR